MRWLLLVALVGCTQPRSTTCKTVCAREAECVAQTSSAMPFDEKECVAACSVLEADQENLAKVQKHKECVERNAHACQQLLECQ